MSSETEPPSDPDHVPEDDTRTIVRRLERKQQTAAGAANVWRLLGGVAVTIGLALAAAGYGYAQQAAVDHERVDRLESTATETAADLDAIRSSLARIEGRLDGHTP